MIQLTSLLQKLCTVSIFLHGSGWWVECFGIMLDWVLFDSGVALVWPWAGLGVAWVGSETVIGSWLVARGSWPESWLGGGGGPGAQVATGNPEKVGQCYWQLGLGTLRYPRYPSGDGKS